MTQVYTLSFPESDGRLLLEAVAELADHYRRDAVHVRTLLPHVGDPQGVVRYAEELEGRSYRCLHLAHRLSALMQ